MKHYLQFLLLTLFLGVSNAQATSVSGNVFGHWTIANSPYHVVNNLTIPSDSTLFVDAGVEIIFDANFELKVDGNIIAVGTITDSITFAAPSIIPGFAGIRFEVTNAQQDSSIFEYCIVQYANRGNQFLTGMDNYGGGILINNFNKVRIQHCTINNCRAFDAGAGIMLYNNSSIYILDNTVSYNQCLNASSNVGEGGGIFCKGNSNPIISRNYIHHNNASLRGGALNIVSSSPIITHNHITQNSTYPIYITGNVNAYLESNNIEYNNSPSGVGPAISANNTGTVSILHNNISNNVNHDYSGTLRGGGVYVANAANVLIKNNTINKNSVSVSTITSLLGGGGIYCNTSANALIVGNSICNNQSNADGDGGGVYVKSATLINNIICNNMCAGYPLAGRGGGVYAQDTVVLINNTIANNYARLGGGVYINGHRNSKMYNCIVWGNDIPTYGKGKQVYCYNGLTTLNYTIQNCDIDSGQAGIGLLNNNLLGMTYQNNIDTIPYFVNPTDTAWPSADATLADWRLAGSSACINAGDSTKVSEQSDIIGNSRIYDVNVDIGAYEYQSSILSLPTANFVLSNNVLCEEDTLQIQNISNNANSYLWTFEDGIPSISTSQNPNVTWNTIGVKTIKLIVSNTSGVDSLTQTISVNTLPIASTISAIGSSALCLGDSITLNGNNGGTWSNGYTSASISVNQAGNYSVINTNSCGSITSNSIDITVNTVDTAVMVGNASLLANATNATYQWLLCNGTYSSIAGETNQTFQPTMLSAFYAVAVTQNGCSDTSSCHLFVYTDIASRNIISNTEVSIYPNPATNSISILGLQNQKVIISNNLGEILFSKYIAKVNEYSMPETIDVSSFSEGIYFVRLGNEVQKFVKE